MDPLSAAETGVKVVKCACTPFAHRIKYLWNLEDNLSILEQKNEELLAQEADIRRKVETAKFNRKMASDRVSLLLQDVTKIKDQVSSIIASLEENNGCFCDCYSRLKLAKDVVEITLEVDNILGKTSQFANELVVEQSPAKALTLDAPTLVGKSTVEKNLDEILKSLRDPEIHKLGIYAMGGSGKTTTMKKINNQLATTEDFDKIIWVTVSKDYNLDKVQNDIAAQLNLEFSTNASLDQRSSELHQSLKQAKKFLIILDDMWVLIPLDKVGIPEPNGENGCKIVLTTRSSAVCRDMKTQKNFKLELLSEEEAWDLFVGDQVITFEVQPHAKDVVRECAGLPLAIITVGRAMRGELDVRIWRNAVKDLRNSPSEIRGMEDDVFKLLHFSYSRLRNDRVQKCFLYLALFPEDEEVPANQLIRCWMDENYIKEEGDIEAEFDEGFKILKEIVDACMFEQFLKQDGTGSSNDHIFAMFSMIRMHDLLRDLAIKIIGEQGGVLAKSGSGSTKAPNEEEWNNVSKISLMGNAIEILPDQPNCPKLSTLLLNRTGVSHIPPPFFLQMPVLQVLDLSSTWVHNLPSSLSDLHNLQSLILQGCSNLTEIPSLAKLKKLQVLNLSLTSIENVPQGMEGLISLRYLNLSETRYLKSCSIPDLPLLEELRMKDSKFWEMESPTVTKFIKEIVGLNRLAILTLSFVLLDDYVKAFMDIKWKMLKKFWIFVAAINSGVSDYAEFPAKSLMMLGQTLESYSPSLLFPPNTQFMFMTHSEIGRLSEAAGNLKFLKTCVIDSCSWSKASGNGLFLGDEVEENAFPSLEHLSIGMYDLPAFWKGMVPHGCLGNLRVLEVVDCQHLKHLCDISLIQNLKNIEVINVSGGNLMEQMVVSSNEEGLDDDCANAITAIILPRLHTLGLEFLYNLHTISSEQWVCDSLRFLSINTCPSLNKLPFSVDTISKLEEFDVQFDWWKTLEWGDVDAQSLADLNSKLYGEEEEEEEEEEED